MVVNPADVPTKNKERTGKTDRVDCRKLAGGFVMVKSKASTFLQE
jgi:hypothetical protein